MLHPSVSSDWQRLQILTAAGVNRTSDEGLYAALKLVRGAPLADAAPGQWHWAEMLRTDMISCVRDIGVELTDRALLAGDLDLARWAASRALIAAPGDELLFGRPDPHRTSGRQRRRDRAVGAAARGTGPQPRGRPGSGDGDAAAAGDGGPSAGSPGLTARTRDCRTGMGG